MLPGQSAVWGLLLYIQINILLSVEPALYDYIIHVLLCDRNRKQFPVWDIISAVMNGLGNTGKFLAPAQHDRILRCQPGLFLH